MATQWRLSFLFVVVLSATGWITGTAPAAADPSAYSKRRGTLLERYFGRSWLKADPNAAETPASLEPSPIPTDPNDPDNGQVHAEHSPVGHMFITRKAYELYASRYGGGELAQYIGEALDTAPASAKEDNVVEGAFEEDSPYKNPWNEMIQELRHFWDCRKGRYAGLSGHDSGVNRANKYFTGGHDLEGGYDSGWSGKTGKNRGTKGRGVLYLYRHGNKGKAYWYLGHAAHLLEDLTVPAHTLLWPHPIKGSDAYEAYMDAHHRQWSKLPSGPIESFDTLYDLYYQTADATNDFDAGWGAGPASGVDGQIDRGRRRNGGFTEEKLKEEGDVLMPLAYKRVAALYLYFFKQVDKTPPRVTLEFPRSSDENAPDRAAGSRITLSAWAQDDISGIDLQGFRFEYSRRAGKSWSDWKNAAPAPTSSHAAFAVEPGQRYAFRVTAVDAAGNAARSRVKYLSAEPSEPLIASVPE